MPYPGMDPALVSKMDDCVQKVMADGHDKDSAIAICRASIEKEEKTMMDEKAATSNPGDYLIVEDPEKTTTYHLQVKVDGKPDHRLMGAAWAALHGGFRGSKYEGPGKQEAIARLRKLYEAEEMTVPAEKEAGNESLISQLVDWLMGWVRKEGKRNSMTDLERLQKAHDLLVENGAQCTLKVYKGEDGRLRWVTFSSTAFQDRDRQIISTKALHADVARADADRQFGPLSWWHLDGINLGQCDYNAMSGKVLIESGTFNDEVIGLKIKEAADDLAVSIGFAHPPDEPDADGVFHHIRRFERSLLPAGKASNLFTQLSVSKEQSDMTLLKEKFDELVKLIGQGPAEALAKKAEQTEKAAEAAGVAYKELPATDAPPAVAPEAKEAAPDFGGMIEKCLKACNDLGARLEAHEKAHKEAHDQEEAQVQKAAKEQADQIALLAEAVKELMGETPRAAKGFRPTQESSTIRTEEPAGPQPNQNFATFIDFMTGGKPA